jgi:hypothetical protein
LLKLEILTSICCKENIEIILKELQTYVKDKNCKFVCTAIRAIGRVADAVVDGSLQSDSTTTSLLLDSSDYSTAVANTCMEGLMHLLICSRFAFTI